MARQRKEDPPKGAPAWQSTFSDLMNLLLCFFVLLFSMSTVDAEKMEMVIQSFQQAFSILPAGGTTISDTDGSLISSGVSALEQFDVYFNASTSNAGETRNENNDDSGEQTVGDTGQDSETATDAPMSEEQIQDEFEKQALSASEQMAEAIEAQAELLGISDLIDVSFNGQYVEITLNGAVLFNSGSAEVMEEAKPLLSNLAKILNNYGSNLIQIEGHTDSVPIHSSRFESNDVLSMYRALSVANFMRGETSIEPGNIVSAGRGEYDPIADNSTAEGRALNRRVEIKIYNALYSDISE